MEPNWKPKRIWASSPERIREPFLPKALVAGQLPLSIGSLREAQSGMAGGYSSYPGLAVVSGESGFGAEEVAASGNELVVIDSNPRGFRSDSAATAAVSVAVSTAPRSIEPRLQTRSRIAPRVPEGAASARDMDVVTPMHTHCTGPPVSMATAGTARSHLLRISGARKSVFAVTGEATRLPRTAQRNDAMCQKATSGRSSRVGVSQISWSPILIDASADRHFNRGMHGKSIHDGAIRRGDAAMGGTPLRRSRRWPHWRR